MRTEVLKAFIVEDKQSAKEALEKLIEKHTPEVQIIGWSQSVRDAVEQVNELKPQILFLDIQLGSEQSFSLFDQLNVEDYYIIFTTAYEHYAIEAFSFSAIDYLLKPIDSDRLHAAIDRLKTLESRNNVKQAMLDALLQNTSSSQPKNRKLVLSTLEMLHVVDTGEIIKCQSSLNYTTFFLEGGKQIIVSRTLKEYEDMLDVYGFFRLHKSWLINTAFLTGYDKREGGYAIMKDDSKVPVSTNKRDRLMKILKGKAS